MLTPSFVLAYWMRGSMAELLYASGLSLSRCHYQQAVAALARRKVRLGGVGVNGRADSKAALPKVVLAQKEGRPHCPPPLSPPTPRMNWPMMSIGTGKIIVL